MSGNRIVSEKDRIIREQKFKQQLLDANPNLELTGKYINALTNVEFRCNRCGEEHQIASPQSLIKLMSKCARCDSERKLLVGLTDFATTHPQYAKLFKNQDEAKTISYGSGRKVDMICPICHNEKKISPSHLIRRGFSCPKCGDGVSYPNKFMYNLLKKLKIDFDSEVSFDWSENKRYDFVVKNVIIEMDGGFHKGSNFKSYSECKEIDDLKDKLAINNGYKLIRIECYTSEFEYIKNNILHSELSKILDLKNIEWEELEIEVINSNLVRDASEVFNKYKGIENLTFMAKLMNTSQQTLYKLLKQSSKIGLTDYDSKKSKRGEYTPDRGIHIRKQCICLETKKVYESCLVAENEHKFNKDSVARVCRGERLTVGGLHFDFVDTTEEIQENKRKMLLSDSKPSHSAKKVINTETNKIYNSATEASRDLGKNQGYVSELMCKKRKANEDCIFKYI